MQATALKRISVWTVSCLIFIALIYATQGPAGTMDVVYRITLLYVLPLWVVFLPVTLKVKDAQGPRIWIILGYGLLTGVVVFAGLSVIQALNRGNPSIIWQGYATFSSMALWTTLAVASGLVVSAIYGMALKMFYRWIQTA